MTLSVSSLSALTSGVHASPSLTAVSSVPLAGAAVANLNITVDPGTVAAADLVVVLNATSGSMVHSASVLLQVVPATPASSSNSPVCAGNTINLSTPALAGATYAWSGPNGFTSSQQNPTIANAPVANAGTYSVTVTVNKRTSAAGTTSVTVNPRPATPVITTLASAVPGTTGLTASITPHVGSTYAWSITNGTITAGQGTTQLTFTAGPSGSVSLGVIETNGCSSLQATASVAIAGPPQNVIATASSSTVVAISWLGNGAPSYKVMRRDPGGVFVLKGTTSAVSYNDITVSANTAYLYVVIAVDSLNNLSAPSIADLATTVIFTDDPLVAQVTTIKASHITELRTAVNAVRILAALGASTFTDPMLDTSVLMSTSHMSELRAALDEARAHLMLPALTYTDTVLTSGDISVKAAHFRELRNGVK